MIIGYNEEKRNEKREEEKIGMSTYGFSFDSVTEEDIIRGAVQSGIAVFLHGRSSEGKSARVKELDPDCEIIYLRNASPEGLNGKSVYNQSTGEMIDIKPTWLTKLEKRCEEEPDKIHIAFFDELTNALHTIQGMAFNIIFDREVNGKWKLPDNARIVAAGNDLSDSVVANTLAEPLFNRFAHVYIETTLDSWLEWAKKPIKSYKRLDYTKAEEQELAIHPAVYAFVSLKARSGVNVLRTKYDGIKPNADPRKWEMASKMLYATKQPEMLRSLVGEGITKDFINFCKIDIISIKQIVDGDFSASDYQGDVDKKYATTLALSLVDEENVVPVRNFVKKMGLEMLQLFDDFWIKGKPERVKMLEDIRSVGLTWGKR